MLEPLLLAEYFAPLMAQLAHSKGIAAPKMPMNLGFPIPLLPACFTFRSKNCTPPPFHFPEIAHPASSQYDALARFALHLL